MFVTLYDQIDHFDHFSLLVFQIGLVTKVTKNLLRFYKIEEKKSIGHLTSCLQSLMFC